MLTLIPSGGWGMAEPHCCPGTMTTPQGSPVTLGILQNLGRALGHQCPFPWLFACRMSPGGLTPSPSVSMQDQSLMWEEVLLVQVTAQL